MCSLSSDSRDTLLKGRVKIPPPAVDKADAYTDHDRNPSLNVYKLKYLNVLRVHRWHTLHISLRGSLPYRPGVGKQIQIKISREELQWRE